MKSYLHYNKSKFITEIIEALYMKQNIFMYTLTYHYAYEVLLYAWINKFSSIGKSSEEEIKLIYNARNIFLLNSNSILCSDPNLFLKNFLLMLPITYRQLTTQQTKLVYHKIVSWIQIFKNYRGYTT
ncbi:hypothetical protein [Aquimarina spinulae]|uniref:hypothetical protein n=1 Tax=Aquimarina spinulae TaxID=1192023 RepID=UPI000D551636|nr:hypothetical protein [Aquimarina spinulae]